MKQFLALVMSLIMLLALVGCGAPITPSAAPATSTESPTSEASAESEALAIELTVFAAASMQETLSAIAEMYKDVAPNVSIVCNFDSSGTLKTQIQEGAICDVFISAGQKQMNQLDITASSEVNTEGLDFVLDGSRFNILENKVTLCVPEGNPAGITSFDDVAEQLKAGGDFMLAMGNSDVPVGQYTQKILKFYDIDEDAVSSNITYGSNVKEVTSQVSEGTVSCGVIYCTDAFSAGLSIVDSATKDMCGQVIYPAAVMKNSVNPEAAAAFLDFCMTAEAMAVFEGVGFSPVA